MGGSYYDGYWRHLRDIMDRTRRTYDKFPEGAQLGTKRYFERIGVDGNIVKYEFKFFIAKLITFDVYNAKPNAGVLKCFDVDVENMVSLVDARVLEDIEKALRNAIFKAGTKNLSRKKLKKLGV